MAAACAHARPKHKAWLPLLALTLLQAPTGAYCSGDVSGDHRSALAAQIPWPVEPSQGSCRGEPCASSSRGAGAEGTPVEPTGWSVGPGTQQAGSGGETGLPRSRAHVPVPFAGRENSVNTGDPSTPPQLLRWHLLSPQQEGESRRGLSSTPSGTAHQIRRRSIGAAKPRRRSLPQGPLIMAYATGCRVPAERERVVVSAESGVSVLLWFSISLGTDPASGAPRVEGGQDLDCIADVSSTLRARGVPTVHMVSIGGWNAPHPDADNHSPEEFYSAWKDWNERTVARPGLEGGFDGIDWDLEGFDDVGSKDNQFSVRCLELMGRFSQLAKADGYLASLVPAESYLDSATPRFDRSLRHAYPEWHPEFRYHGHNVYALLVSKFGSTEVVDAACDSPGEEAERFPGAGIAAALPLRGTSAHTGRKGSGSSLGCSPGREEGSLLTARAALSRNLHSVRPEAVPAFARRRACTRTVPTFDFVSIQLYETYSHADYNITAAPVSERQSPVEYLVSWVKQVVRGWKVDFGSDPEVGWPSQRVVIPPEQLVVGLANAWAGRDPRWLLIQPEDVGEAYSQLAQAGVAPRGFVFFDTNSEGRVNPADGRPLFMAEGLHRFLGARATTLNSGTASEKTKLWRRPLQC